MSQLVRGDAVALRLLEDAAELTPTGLSFRRDLSFDEWQEYGSRLQRVEGAVQWWIGDWLRYGERKYGEMYAQAIEATGRSYNTLAKAVYVAGAFEFLRRRKNLTWGHHEAVASMEPGDQDALLSEAEAQNWSRSDLRQAARTYRQRIRLERAVTEAEGTTAARPPEIHHGDAVEWLASLPNNYAACCVTDPPYGLEVHNTRGGVQDYADNPDYALDLLNATAAELVRVLRPDAHLYVFSGYTLLDDFKDVLANYFDVQDNPIVWVKNRHTMCDFRRRYAPKHEYIIFARPVGCERLLNADCSPDVVEYPRVEDPVHSAEKPVALLQHLIQNSTAEGEIVVDPFMGVGSTGVAAQSIGRRFAGCEIHDGYHAEAARRISDPSAAAA